MRAVDVPAADGRDAQRRQRPRDHASRTWRAWSGGWCATTSRGSSSCPSPPSAATRTWSAAIPDNRQAARGPGLHAPRDARGGPAPHDRLAAGGHGAGRPAVIHVVVPAYNEAGNIAALPRGHPRAPRAPGPAATASSSWTTAPPTAPPRPAARPSEPARPVEVVSPPAEPRARAPPSAPASSHVLRDADPARRRGHPGGRPAPATRASCSRMLHRVWEEGDDIVLASCYLYGGGIKGTQLHRVGLATSPTAS